MNKLKEVFKAALVVVLLITCMGLFLAASSRMRPSTIADILPIPTGTIALVVGKLLINEEAVVRVVANSAMTTAVSLLVWLDAPTPEVTPVAGSTAMRLIIGAAIGSGTGTEILYDTIVLNTGFGGSYFTGLTKVVLSSAQSNLKLCVLAEGALDNETSLIIDTSK